MGSHPVIATVVTIARFVKARGGHACAGTILPAWFARLPVGLGARRAKTNATRPLSRHQLDARLACRPTPPAKQRFWQPNKCALLDVIEPRATKTKLLSMPYSETP